MTTFWDSNVWSGIMLMGALLGSVLLANALKRFIPVFRDTLIPASVLGGILLLIISEVYYVCTGKVFFNEAVFGGNGIAVLETVTYHCLALGFISSTLKSSDKKPSPKRMSEIINTGVTTVSTYLIQCIAGLFLTIIIVPIFIKDFFKAAGMLLPLGYGMGTGQAMNYGLTYEALGFYGGTTFGLTIAALGFLSASIGGVFYINYKRKHGQLNNTSKLKEQLSVADIQTDNEIPMQDSVDKITIQFGFVLLTYAIAYIMIYFLGNIAPGLKTAVYGFNYLLGVVVAVIIKAILKALRKTGVMKKEHINNFLMTRICNFFFDLMIVAGIAAIRLEILEKYWGVIIILAILGIIVTFLYNHFVSNKLFGEYHEEQFLMMYGMLTGTASTGAILLREIDPEFNTPASDNMVYQTFPAMILGLPLLTLAHIAPERPIFVLSVMVVLLIVLNIFLFRGFLFKKKNHK